MSGRGKGGKGLGKGGAKRHRKRLRDNIQGITKPAIRRLARRGGVKRLSGMIYEETRGVLKVFLESVIRDAVTYTEYARRMTVTAMDVVYALKRQGKPLYGFGVAPQGQSRGTTKHSKGPRVTGVKRKRPVTPEFTYVIKLHHYDKNKKYAVAELKELYNSIKGESGWCKWSSNLNETHLKNWIKDNLAANPNPKPKPNPRSRAKKESKPRSRAKKESKPRSRAKDSCPILSVIQKKKGESVAMVTYAFSTDEMLLYMYKDIVDTKTKLFSSKPENKSEFLIAEENENTDPPVLPVAELHIACNRFTQGPTGKMESMGGNMKLLMQTAEDTLKKRYKTKLILAVAAGVGNTRDNIHKLVSNYKKLDFEPMMYDKDKIQRSHYLKKLKIPLEQHKKYGFITTPWVKDKQWARGFVYKHL